MKKYYVYCHRNPTTNEIFYIGKGSGPRAYVTQSRGQYWKNYVKKHGIPIVEILYDNLEENESFTLEKQLIESLGRKDLGTGILVNTSDGGTGSSGMVHSNETKNTIREARKGKPSNNKGKTWVQKTNPRTGVKRGNYKTRKDKGKTFSDEVKLNFKEGKRNKSKNVLQYDLGGNFIKEWRSPADVIDALGLKGLYNCLTGISKHSGGFIWKYKEV
jgi:hypothetical protein